MPYQPPRNDQSEEKRQRHLLLISQVFTPEPVHIVDELTQSLVETGLKVTVLTGYPNYPHGKLYDGFRQRLWSKERIGNVDVIRVPLYCAHGPSAIRRALNFLSFAFSVAFIGPWVVPKIDAIHVYQLVTLGWPARWLAFLRGVPVTLEVQDLWPETLAATGMMNRPRLLNAVQSLADNVYRYPAKLRVITEGFRENLVARGVDPSKIEVIPSWVDTELYRPEPRDAALAESLGLADTFNIVFAGAIGLAQNLSTAIDAAAELRDCPDVRMVFIGDGADLQNLKDQAENLQLTNVVFLGRRDVTEMRSLYGLADALMLHLLDEPLFEITIPYKIYAYFASGKPILNAVGGEASRLIQSRGAGISCRSGDPAAMADAVRSLRNMSPEERAALGSAGRQAAVEFYSRPNVTSRVAALVNNAIDEHERLRPTLYDRLKRAIDICVSLIGLVFLSPLLIILAILVRLKLGSPVLFCQKRPGRCGHLFRILKFRTMTDERDENGALLDDSVRLTGFGKFLRSSSFDELPELVNVLRGEMSLVGPRPLLPEYLPLYNDRQNKRHDVRPGITGWAQVNGRNNLNWSDRLELDAWYVENRSLLLDIKIIIKTISQVISRKDVSAEGHATMPRFTGNPSLKDNQ